MSGEYTLIVKLPPEGTLLRDLVVTSLAYIREFGYDQNVEVSFEGSAVKISAQSRDTILDLFKGLYREAAHVADAKSERIRLGILLNDQRILSRLLKREVKGLTYLDAIRDFLYAHASTDLDLSSLKDVEVRDRGIKLGQGNFATINPLVSERYEHGLEFWRLNYERKLEVLLNEEWYALTLAGFAFATASFIDGDLLMVYLPEHFVASEVPEKLLKALGEVHGPHSLQKKVNKIVYEEQHPAEPFSAFVLLVSLNLVKGAENSPVLYAHRYSLPLALCKLRRANNVFTMLEKKQAELFDTLRFAARLMKEGVELVEELIRVARRTLSLRLGAEFTIYNRFCNLLLQSIQGAYSPYEVAYYGARNGLMSYSLVKGIISALS